MRKSAQFADKIILRSRFYVSMKLLKCLQPLTVKLFTYKIYWDEEVPPRRKPKGLTFYSESEASLFTSLGSIQADNCPAYSTWLICITLNLPPLRCAALFICVRQAGHSLTTITAPVCSIFFLFFSSIPSAISG